MNFKTLFSIRLKDIIIMLIFCLAAILVSAILNYLSNSETTISMTFLLAVFFTARFTSGYLCGIAASFLSILIVNYFFTFPYFEINMILPGYPITILSMITVSIVTSMVTSRLVKQDDLKRHAEHEAMRSNLLRSVSHDLRTPLTSIIGATDALKLNHDSFSTEEKIELYEDIGNEAQWLYNMVENMLSVTKLNSSSEKIHKSPELIEEIMPVAVKRIQKYYKNININIRIPDEMIFVPMDSTLIEQVIINLVENSIRHGKTTDTVWISVLFEKNYASFSVLDNGKGIDKSIISSINSGKYISPTPDSDTSKYMGIGISVCEAIIKAHDGYITAENTSVGAKITFYLPLEE